MSPWKLYHLTKSCIKDEDLSVNEGCTYDTVFLAQKYGSRLLRRPYVNTHGCLQTEKKTEIHVKIWASLKSLLNQVALSVLVGGYAICAFVLSNTKPMTQEALRLPLASMIAMEKDP